MQVTGKSTNDFLLKCSLVLLPLQFLPGSLSLSILPIILLLFLNSNLIQISKINLLSLLICFSALALNYSIHSYSGNAYYFLYLKIMMGISLFFMATNLEKKIDLQLDGYIFFLVILAINIVPIFMYLNGWDMVTANSLRFDGFTDHPGNVQLSSTFLIFLLLLTTNKLSFFKKLILFTIIIVLIMQLFFAGGRKAFVALFFGFVTFFALRRNYLLLLTILLTPMALILSSSILLDVFSDSFESIRILEFLESGDFFESDRSRYFLESFYLIQDNIILGKGYGDFAFRYGEEIHNTFISLLYSMGLLFSCMILISFVYMSNFFKLLKLNGVIIIIPHLIIAAFANFIRNEIFWISLIIVYFYQSKVLIRKSNE